MTCKFIINIYSTTCAGVEYDPPKGYSKRVVFYDSWSLYDMQQFFRS